jgi:iron complex outermembrane receptor protein
MGKRIRVFLMLMTLTCLATYSQQSKTDMEAVRIDTVVLEDVTIGVLPFREGSMEATGAVFNMNFDEITRTSLSSSSDLINLAPGVHMAKGTLNTQRLVIRGVGSRTPYNTNRIRVYLDDIPLTTGDGISSLEDIAVSSIGNLAILKGPSSALYGSGLGGIVRFTSPYPNQAGFSGSLLSEFGSFGSRTYGLGSTYKKNGWAMAGGVNLSSTDGYRENSTYKRSNAYLNARRFGKKHTLSLTLHLVKLHAEIPSSLNESDFMNDPTKAGGSWGLINGYEEYLKLLSGVSLESELSRNLKNNITLFSTITDPYERRPFNTLDDRSFNLGVREYLEFTIKKIRLQSGFEYFHEWYNWQIYETLPESEGTLLSDQEEIRRYLNGFLLAQWRPHAKLLIDAGLNVNLLNYSLQTNFRVDSLDQSGEYNYKPVLSPRLGISYRHSGQIWTYATAGSGFSAPSLEETLLPEGTVNNELKPETGWNLELGNRGLLLAGQLQYELAVYSILLKDMLVTERITEDIFTGINAGKARNTGFEISLKGSLYPDSHSSRFNSTLSMAYNVSSNRFLDFVDDGADYSGNTLPGIPVQELAGELTGSFAEILLSLQYRYTGKQWMNDANDQLYEGYHLTNIRLHWNFRIASSPFRFALYAGIRNLFNAHYASMILINAPSFGGRAPRYYYPGSPRQFTFGIRFTYK